MWFCRLLLRGRWWSYRVSDSERTWTVLACLTSLSKNSLKTIRFTRSSSLRSSLEDKSRSLSLTEVLSLLMSGSGSSWLPSTAHSPLLMRVATPFFTDGTLRLVVTISPTSTRITQQFQRVRLLRSQQPFRSPLFARILELLSAMMRIRRDFCQRRVLISFVLVSSSTRRSRQRFRSWSKRHYLCFFSSHAFSSLCICLLCVLMYVCCTISVCVSPLLLQFKSFIVFVVLAVVKEKAYVRVRAICMSK